MTASVALPSLLTTSAGRSPKCPAPSGPSCLPVFCGSRCPPAQFLQKLAKESGFDGELADLTDDILIYHLKMRDSAKDAVIPGLQKDYEEKGVQAMLDAVIDYLPSPVDVPAINGILDDGKDTPAERHASDDEPFSALVLTGDNFSGNVTFVNTFVCQHRLTDDIADSKDVR